MDVKGQSTENVGIYTDPLSDPLAIPSISEEALSDPPAIPSISEEAETLTTPTDVERSNRSFSPMQEILKSEQRWQGFMHKLDGKLSANGLLGFSQAAFCDIFKQEETMVIFFKLFDWDNTGRVKQEKFVDQTRYALKATGSYEWVNLVEVLAYAVCGEGNDLKEPCFKKIFLSKGVLEKMYDVIEKVSDGHVTKKSVLDFMSNLTCNTPREGLTKENIEHLEKVFRDLLGEKSELSFDDFKKIVHSRNPFFAERMFDVFDRDKNGSISLAEFLDSMHRFAGKSPEDKIQLMFRVYDLDGDGLIQREELYKVMKACMEENKMKFDDEQIEDLTLALFEDADKDNRGAITYENLKAQLEDHSTFFENLSISIDRWLLPPQTQEKKKKKTFNESVKTAIPYQLRLTYIRNNYAYIFFLLFFFGVNVGMFIDRFIEIYNDKAFPVVVYYAIARGCGHCLNFNCMFILIMVLRHTLTFLRNNGLSSYLPLDEHLHFHKLCGFVILFHSVVHTVMHLINFPTQVVPATDYEYTAIEWLFTIKPGKFGLIEGWANITGFVLIFILIIMVICSLPFVRKSGNFEVFYFTHLLYIGFFALTIIHGPHFWKWFIVPGIIFFIEKLYISVQMKYRKCYISSGILLPSKVTHLVIQRPMGFHFHPGDYVFVNIPEIAKYEWHPFTISSAPEQEEAVWLHIRGVGQWTNRLYEYFQKQRNIHEETFMEQIAGKIESDTKMLIEDRSLTKKKKKRKDPDEKIKLLSSSDVKKIQSSTEEQISEIEGGKKMVDKTKSVPAFNKTMISKERKLMVRASLMPYSQGNDDEEKLQFAINRSALQSSRYHRRRPKVITLDMPESTEIEGDEDREITLSQIEEGRGPKRALTRLNTVLRGRGKEKDRISSDSKRARRESRMNEAISMGSYTYGKPIAIYIDGAYGAPSSHIFRSQHAVLIATGIGVTPFASILQSIMHRYLKSRQTCPKCEHQWTSEIPLSVMNLRKVDFFWINRDQRSFEWFVNLLSQLEIEQAEQGGMMERFLDMHMYITSALQKTDMKAAGLQLAMDLLHRKEKRDLITGLKTRTNPGRPNWDKIFKQLSSQHKGKITVFFCGPHLLARTLKYKCGQFGFEFRKEIF